LPNDNFVLGFRFMPDNNTDRLEKLYLEDGISGETISTISSIIEEIARNSGMDKQKFTDGCATNGQLSLLVSKDGYLLRIINQKRDKILANWPFDKGETSRLIPKAVHNFDYWN
jgi:hypothetical protein